MKTVLVCYTIIRVLYCEKLFVAKYTTVEIACPFVPSSWYNDQPLMIAVNRKVNSRFTSRYGISDTLNLKILNFTDADQGRYMCRGVVGENYEEYTVIVNVCSIPDKISNGSFEQNEYFSLSERKLLCTEDSYIPYNNIINKKGIIRIFKPPISQQNVDDRNKKTTNLRSMKYKCLTLNADNCVISNTTYQLNVEWILSNKTTRASNETQLYACTCKWNASNMEDNVPCNETIHMYYSSKAIYISDPEKNATGSYECELVENDVLKKNTTTSGKEIMKIFPMYSIIAVFVVCGMILVSVLIWGIRRASNKANHNIDNIPRRDASHDLQIEGYSSIERRLRLEVGQQVSYTASRLSRLSIGKERGNGKDHEPGVSPKGTKNQKAAKDDDRMQVSNSKIQTAAQINLDKPILNYIDVQFDTNTVGRQFIIHGSENATPYADIDLTIKADPLPESDSSDEEEQDNTSEFMTLEDIQKLGK